MEIKNTPIDINTWKIEKIGIIGPGIVGMPMAAMLANAKIKIGTDQPAKVIVVQRNSVNSGWKVDTINRLRSHVWWFRSSGKSLTKKAFIKNPVNNY